MDHHIETFGKHHLNSAFHLARSRHERFLAETIPSTDEVERLLKEQLERTLQQGQGLAIMEKEELLGFLLIESSFPGEWHSPLGCNCLPYGKDNCVKEAFALLQKVTDAKKLSLTCFLPEGGSREALLLSGWKEERCYALRAIGKGAYPSLPFPYTIRELPPESYLELKELKKAFDDHLSSPPINRRIPQEERDAWFQKDGKHIYVLEEGVKHQGFLALQEEGPDYLTRQEAFRNSAGLYLDPTTRGRGLAPLLLSHVLEELEKKGIKFFGTSFDLSNQSGRNFWEKTFTPYAIQYGCEF